MISIFHDKLCGRIRFISFTAGIAHELVSIMWVPRRSVQIRSFFWPPLDHISILHGIFLGTLQGPHDKGKEKKQATFAGGRAPRLWKL